MNNLTAYICFFWAFIFFFAGMYKELSAFPERNRDGYRKCISCHISPSGGGVLKDYGKVLSTQMSSFLTAEQNGYSDLGLIPKEKRIKGSVYIGGNIRQVALYQTTSEAERERKFLMQADLELAMELSKKLLLSGTAGYYNIQYGQYDDLELEYRRYYAQYKPFESLRFRFGQFFPNFGLMIADHTEKIRSIAGYSQNRETTNKEVGFYSNLFTLVYTRSVNSTNRHKNEKAFHIGKLELYWGDYSSSSFSLKLGEEECDDQIAIDFRTAGFNEKWYLMAESLMSMDENIKDVFFIKSGFELGTGFIPYTKFVSHVEDEYSIGTQWLIIPHFELNLETTFKEDYFDYTIITNYYF